MLKRTGRSSIYNICRNKKSAKASGFHGDFHFFEKNAINPHKNR